MRKISSAKKKALRTGLSFALTFAMALGSVPTDGIAYAAITNGAKTPQIETKVETPETPATTPVDAGIAAGTMTALTTDVTADEPKTVKVRFDANGGEGHMDDFEVTLNGGDWSVAETPFTRDGYRFVGWSVAADVAKDAVDDPDTDIDESLTGVVLADKQEFVDFMSQKRDEDGNVVETHDFGKYVSDDVLTLYAQWEKVETSEVSASVVDENEVAKTEENVDGVVASSENVVSEDASVGKDNATEATSDKELDKELLSGAFGNKTDGGVADKIGTSNPLSRKLMAPLMAAAAPSLKAQSTPEGSREGTAYAVLDDAGTLTLFRSTSTYTAGTRQTVTDIAGNTYTGQVYTGIEDIDEGSGSVPWYDQRYSVKLARIADGQVIAPKSCASWFYQCSDMTAFEGAERLDTSAVTVMYNMFSECWNMTEPPAVGNWDVSVVTDMYGMFYDCSSMTEPPAVGNWDTSAVAEMGDMFNSCRAMTEPPAVGNWDTHAVTYISYMFFECSAMTEPPSVGNWNTSAMIDPSFMFCGCSSMTEPPAVSNWNTNAVTNMSGMFSECSAMTESPAVSNWNTSAVTDMSSMFNGCLAMTSLDVSGWDFSALEVYDDPYNSDWTPNLGLDECSALRELKVPAGAKLSGLPEHTVQGVYLSTWGNAERGITGSTAENLVSTVNAGNGAGTWKWEINPQARAGTAYAVLDSAGTLTLFRSTNTYTAGTGKTVTDVMGNTYTGQVYTGIETNTGINFSSARWFNQRSSVKLARIADGQVIAPKSCAGWFYGCSNMTTFESAEQLDTSAVTNMYYMFGSCSAMTEPPAMGSWNTSAVTKMDYMFYGCSAMAMSPAVGSWDTSAVTNMSYMFYNCSAMTEPPAVGGWNTSKVANMSYMFYNCSAMMESPAVGSWNTWAVTNMGYMFNGCSKVSSLDVSGWDFSKVIYSSYYLGLQRCSALRELKVPAGAKISGLPEHVAQGDYVETWGNADRGITGSTAANLVTTVNAGNGAGTWTWDPIPENGLAYGILDSAGTLTLFRSKNIYTAGTGQTVTDVMGNTYTGQVYTGVETNTGTNYTSARWYNQRSSVKLARIADGQVIAPKSCAGWFYGCSKMTVFDGAERLDTSAVTNMSAMFQSCSSMTEQPSVGNWNVSAVTNMSYMFSGCSKMAEPPAVGGWNTSAVTDMYQMFYGCSAITEPPAVGSWDTGKVTNMGNIFAWCSAMTEPPSVGSWNTSAVTSMGGMFNSCSAMTEPPSVGSWDTSAVTGMGNMFSNCSKMTEPPSVGNWNTSKVTSMGNMFSNCSTMTESPVVGSWDTSAVTSMGDMFSGCSKMVEAPSVGSWNTSKVTNMSAMFQSCNAMTEPPAVGNWNTSAVTNMSFMFSGCWAMTEPPAVGSWSTGSVTGMNSMFQSCSSMTESPSVGNWNTSAVTNMASMFLDCSKMMSLDMSGWAFSKVTSSSNYLGLQNCSVLKELKVPASAKIAGLPEHSAQGDYLATWGNADRGITGSTAANLMSVVNAGNGAGTWTWDKAAAEYTVNFMVDGSSTAMQAERVKADEDYVVPSCEVTKLYHDFVEWSGSDGNTYHAGDVVTAGTFAAGETLTLTAVFAPHEYGPGEFDGNLQLSVPASINFVVEPDGTLTGPSNASIVNSSGVNTRVSSVEVKELGNFNFVANAEASGEQNAVELRFGPLSDMLDAASFLSKGGVDDSAWTMGTTVGQNAVQLETEGKVAHVGADITKVNKFGEVRWYVKAGE